MKNTSLRDERLALLKYKNKAGTFTNLASILKIEDYERGTPLFKSTIVSKPI